MPLPAVPEVFGVRLPPASESLTAVDFDLVPNKPPPGVKLYDEEVEEIEESESEEGGEDDEDEDDEDMEPAPIPSQNNGQDYAMHDAGSLPPPVSAMQTPSEMGAPDGEAEEGSEEEDGLFAGGDEEEEEEEADAMEEVQAEVNGTVNGVKRKLVEEDDYD